MWGTAVHQATTHLMGRAHLRAGQKGLVQFRLAEPLNAALGEAFVIALLNRNQVLGGGVLLERTRQKYRPAKHDAVVPFLEALEARDIPACADVLLQKKRASSSVRPGIWPTPPACPSVL